MIKAGSDYWAFTPKPLPGTLEFDSELVYGLSEADSALSELNGVARVIPNPALYVAPYTRVEALLSSRIEGTVASLPELYMFETSPERGERKPDVQEVVNYIKALNAALEDIKTLPLSLRFIKEVHKNLMKGVRGHKSTPGEFRTTQNWVGPAGCNLTDATYVPPPVPDMHKALDNWEKYLYLEDSTPILVKAAIMHYQFEAIHPFLDGNGRIGRILIILFLVVTGRLSYPMLYLSRYFEETREEYYERLLDVSRRGLWEDWVKYFLKGVYTQSKDALETGVRISTIKDEYNERISGIRATADTFRLVELLFTYPYIHARKAAAELGLNYHNVYRGFKKLEGIGIVSRYGRRGRDIIYRADKLADLLDVK